MTKSLDKWQKCFCHLFTQSGKGAGWDDTGDDVILKGEGTGSSIDLTTTLFLFLPDMLALAQY